MPLFLSDLCNKRIAMNDKWFIQWMIKILKKNGNLIICRLLNYMRL